MFRPSLLIRAFTPVSNLTDKTLLGLSESDAPDSSPTTHFEEFPVYGPETKILVTDDSPAMRLTIVNALTQLGFKNFTQAGNGNEAYDLLTAAVSGPDPFQLLFSDQNMPECTGMELLARVRANPTFKKLPVIMITSETAKEMIVGLVQAGASNYLPKPFSVEQLQTKLTATFERMAKLA